MHIVPTDPAAPEGNDTAMVELPAAVLAELLPAAVDGWWSDGDDSLVLAWLALQQGAPSVWREALDELDADDRVALSAATVRMVAELGGVDR